MDQHPERLGEFSQRLPHACGDPRLGGFVSVPTHVSGKRRGGAVAAALPLFFVVLCCFLWCCAGLGCRWSTDDGFPGVGATCRNASVGSGGLGSGGNGAAEECARVPGPPRRRLTVRLPMPCPGIAGSAAGWTR